MEGELIIVSLISSTFGLIGIMLLNHNWFARQKMKYNYQIKRAKLSKKHNTPVKEEKSPVENISQWLPLLKNLDGDQIGALADRFLGGGEEIEEASAGLEGILDKIPPELIDSFIKGISKKESGTNEPFSPQS